MNQIGHSLKEEIEIIKLLADKYSDDIDIDLYEPENIETINSFEQSTGVSLPDELKEFYQLIGGFDSLMAYMQMWNLEDIKERYHEGYCDWIEEGDSDKYIVLGSTGGGEYLLMEKATGNYLRYGDEGEVMNIPSIKDLMCWNIDSMYEQVSGFEEDDTINDYLQRNSDRL